jgi:hypothetical protein
MNDKIRIQIPKSLEDIKNWPETKHLKDLLEQEQLKNSTLWQIFNLSKTDALTITEAEKSLQKLGLLILETNIDPEILAPLLKLIRWSNSVMRNHYNEAERIFHLEVELQKYQAAYDREKRRADALDGAWKKSYDY